MTSSKAKETIQLKLSTVLPGALLAAGLSDFEDYLDEQPNNPEKRQIGVYIEDEGETGDKYRLTVVVVAQLFKVGDWKQKYHGVIFPMLRQYITAELIEYVERESINADLWPVDHNSTSWNFFIIEFSYPLDDED